MSEVLRINSIINAGLIIPYWASTIPECVDDPIGNSDYGASFFGVDNTSGGSGNYPCTFGFSNPTINTDDIIDVIAYITIGDTGDSGLVSYGYIRTYNTNYLIGSGTANWVDRSVSFTVNPKTLLPWTEQELTDLQFYGSMSIGGKNGYKLGKCSLVAVELVTPEITGNGVLLI